MLFFVTKLAPLLIFGHVLTPHFVAGVCRFGSLSEPCNIRRENLEDSLLLYTFYRDVDDEMSWIREKRPIAAMTDLGTNLQTVQSLQKKHQVVIKTKKLAYYGHTTRKRELPRERDNARCMQARKTTHGLDGQHQDVDRTPHGRVSQNDRGQR